MGDGLEEHGAILGMTAVGVERAAQAAFDHADHGFHLPALSIAPLFLRSLEVRGHLAAIASPRRLGGRPADLRWNDRTDIEFVPQEFMHPFAVIACVRQNRFDSSAFGRRQHRLDDVRMVGARAATGHRRQDQM